MEPETLETILKWTGIGLSSVAGISMISALTSAVSNYNISKQTYDNWTKIAEKTEHEDLKKYIENVQEEIGKPNLKIHLKESIKSITNIILRDKTHKSHYDKMTSQHIDIIWKRNMLDLGLYKLGNDGNLYEPGKGNLRIVS